MATTKAVLSIVELLEAIILEMPPEPIPSLQLVSRHWKQVIESSSRIHYHYQSRVRTPKHWSTTLSMEGIPVYQSSANIEVHPVLRHYSRVASYSKKSKIIEFVFNREDFHDQGIISFRQEFATTPPCQTCKSPIYNRVVELLYM